jgi:hypothetical protein
MGPVDSLLTVRDRIDAGRVTGARMFVAGNIVGFRAVFTTPEAMASASRAFQQRVNRFEAGGGPDLCLLHPRELAARMTDCVSQGVGFVKYGATGDGDPVNSEIGQAAALRFSPISSERSWRRCTPPARPCRPAPPPSNRSTSRSAPATRGDADMSAGSTGRPVAVHAIARREFIGRSE